MNTEIQFDAKKQKASYTIRKDILKRFNDLAWEKKYNKSFVVEQLLADFIKKQN